jgi:hypothetical protein
MKSILSALILSAAAFGAAQAGELGYLDNPGSNTQSSVSRAQVQNELAQARALGETGNGELVNIAHAPQAQASQLSRAQVQRDIELSRGIDLNGNGELDSPVSNG